MLAQSTKWIAPQLAYSRLSVRKVFERSPLLADLCHHCRVSKPYSAAKGAQPTFVRRKVCYRRDASNVAYCIDDLGAARVFRSLRGSTRNGGRANCISAPRLLQWLAIRRAVDSLPGALRTPVVTARKSGQGPGPRPQRAEVPLSTTRSGPMVVNPVVILLSCFHILRGSRLQTAAGMVATSFLIIAVMR